MPGSSAGRRSTAERGSRTPDPLPESASLLLDMVRFGLCLLVLVGHATLPPFQQGWPPLLELANGAVPGFFVLSGFVIRFVTQTRERQAKRYWVSRASRIYSVALPAVALTLVLDGISRWVNPAFYRTVTLPEPWSGMPLRVLLSLLFLSQTWGHAGLLLSNLPFWSLGYEVPYYVLFGILTFTKGMGRALLTLATALLFGPQILFLLPIWWSGIWLYDLWQWLRQPQRSKAVRVAAVSGAIAALAWLLLPVHGVSGFLRVQAISNPLTLLHLPVMRASMFEYAAGMLSFAVLFLLLCASDLVRLPKKTMAARVVRQTAEGTFTLYLFHFPMLVLASALHLYRPDRGADKVVLLLSITLCCVLAAVPIAHFKSWLRDRMSRRQGVETPRYS